MATHPSILPWESPWSEEPGGLQSLGSQIVVCVHVRVRAHTHTHTRGKTIKMLLVTDRNLQILLKCPFCLYQIKVTPALFMPIFFSFGYLLFLPHSTT